MRSYTVEKKYIISDGRRMKLLILRPTRSKKSRTESGRRLIKGVRAGSGRRLIKGIRAGSGRRSIKGIRVGSGRRLSAGFRTGLEHTAKKVSTVLPPGILWIHGGGYATGMAEMIYMSRALALVKKYGAVVVTPEYRLSGKAPYPAALKDCYVALRYLKAHAKELGCNPDQIMVGGESAGGGLTAALCMYARDRGEVKIAFQMPLYPMIDHMDTESSRDNHGISWNTRRNHAAWKLYLRNVKGQIPAYAAPARQTNYSKLPPAYTFVGDKEPFYCETLEYVENLRRAGIPAKVDVYPTGFHAFDMLLPFRKISRQAVRAFEQQYLYAAKHYFAAQDDRIEEGCFAEQLIKK